MKTVRGQGNANDSAGAQLPRLVLTGDAQAEAVALILKKVAALTDRFEVVFDGSTETSKREPERCAFWLVQNNGRAREKTPARHGCTRVTFPPLHFRLLWPLAAPNPYNVPGSPTAFPGGDSFISACLAQGLHPDDILFHYQSQTWNSSWPNLDMLFRDETTALLAADAKCEVKIGSFILKNFRKRRLFWSPLAPSDDLLLELAYRLMHVCFGSASPVERHDLAAALQSISVRGIFANVAIPVHPLVASHFGLEWYDAQEQVSTLEGSKGFTEYYRDMIAYFAAKQGATG